MDNPASGGECPQSAMLSRGDQHNNGCINNYTLTIRRSPHQNIICNQIKEKTVNVSTTGHQKALP